MSVLESETEAKAVKYAEERGYITFKVSPFSQRGWPDRVFINIHGHHIYIEMKRGSKKPRKLQAHRIEQLKQRNVETHWSSSIEAIRKILRDGMDTT